MTDAGNDDQCRVSGARKGADKHKKLDPATSKALAEGAGGADKIATSCQRSQPGGTGTNGQEKPTQAGNHGHGQGGEPPSSTYSKPDRGKGGPPPSSDGGNPERGNPPETGPDWRSLPTSPAEQQQTTGASKRPSGQTGGPQQLSSTTQRSVEIGRGRFGLLRLRQRR
jgi:hypothetical protein